MTKSELLKNAKPILFTTEMVRAILNGKTQTRRVVKLSKGNEDGRIVLHGGELREEIPALDGYMRVSPKYRPGDILHVQETWRIHDLNNPAFCMMIKYKSDDSTNLQVEFKPSRYDKFKKFYYKNGWQSPYFLPKEAARIFLRVTGVRVERLQDISPEDCIKEGGRDLGSPGATIDYFANEIWNSTIKPADMNKYGWDANPWVWVYDFERVDADDI